jgi:DNA replication licensing factor MCM2
VLQEPPGSVPAGRIPRSRDVILVDDLCDMARPGEQIKLTGIYKHIFDPGVNAMNGFPVFSTVIEANHILKEKDYYAQYEISDDDRAEIMKISKLPDLEQRLINSIAPSIYGHGYIKRALAYAMFSGQEKRQK